MDKLINLNVIEAKNVICVWRDDCNDDRDFFCGIACDTAAISYVIPQYIAIGTFDNGKAMAGGLLDLNEINISANDGEEHDLFLYHQFMDYVGIDEAKALVRGGISYGDYDDEQSAKMGIYADMLRAGLKMSDEAKDYFNDSQRQINDDALNK